MTAPTTVTVRLANGGFANVEGREVAPGLAITPSQTHVPNRYILTHIPSGLHMGRSLCSTHIEIAARIAAAAEINWTRDKRSVVADPAFQELAQTVWDAIGWCHADCDLRTQDGQS